MRQPTPVGVWVAVGLAAWAGLRGSWADEGVGLDAANSNAETLDLPGPWVWTLSLRTWGGYNDNPRLSAVNPTGSALVAGGGDFMVFRDGEEGHEANLFVSAEQVGYLEEGIDPETLVIAQADYTRRWSSGWLAGASMEYLYLRQVYDASEVVGVPVVIPTRGHTWSFRPKAGHEWESGWSVEVAGDLTYQWLADPLDSYWDRGVDLTVTWEPGIRDRLQVNGGILRRSFEDRLARAGDGELLDRVLAYDQAEVEALWSRVWDDRRRWRTTLRGGYRVSVDNGGGVFDYDRWGASVLVRHVAKRWEVRLDARARWYLYPGQVGGEMGSGSRRRTDVTLTGRGEYEVWRNLRVFVQYTLEDSDENAEFADYRMNTVVGGLEYSM